MNLALLVYMDLPIDGLSLNKLRAVLRALFPCSTFSLCSIVYSKSITVLC